MKKNNFLSLPAVFTALILSSFCTIAMGKVITVSNNAISAGQYTNLSSAISAAGTGDTLYVMGSPNDYASSSVTISKPITLIGAGYNPVGTQYGYPTTISNIYFSGNSSANAKGTKIMGISCAQIISNDTFETNISISRSYIYNYIDIAGTNWTIQNCIVNNIDFNGFDYGNGGVYSAAGYNGPIAIIVDNFIMGSITSDQGYYYGTIKAAHILINHNILEGPITYFKSCNIIANNIFWYANQSYYNSVNTSNCSFRNNVTVESFKDTLNNSGSSDIATSNIYNPSSLFNGTQSSTIGYPTLVNDDWTVKAVSSAHKAASDGTDIGIYGGVTPMPNFTGATTLPQLTYFDINNLIIPVGGKLNANFKGRTQN